MALSGTPIPTNAASRVVLSDREYEGVFAIIAPVFKGGNKWRLSDGNATSNVAIADRVFLERVDARQESFFKGDLLKCKIRTQQWQTESGLRTEHEVLKVVEHIKSGNPLTLLPFTYLPPHRAAKHCRQSQHTPTAPALVAPES